MHFHAVKGTTGRQPDIYEYHETFESAFDSMSRRFNLSWVEEPSDQCPPLANPTHLRIDTCDRGSGTEYIEIAPCYDPACRPDEEMAALTSELIETRNKQEQSGFV
jgi:hypothetical protein